MIYSPDIPPNPINPLLEMPPINWEEKIEDESEDFNDTDALDAQNSFYQEWLRNKKSRDSRDFKQEEIDKMIEKED